MGIIISRWRKNPSTSEVLEQLNKDIDHLEKLKRNNLEKQRKIIGSLLLYSVIGYVLGAVFFYFYYWPEQWLERLLYCTPLLVFPFLVWLMKRFLHWYFVKRIAGNEGALEDLKERKKSILEEVMEKETYKKAKEILEKFDPDRFKILEAPQATPAPVKAPEGQELRQRMVKSGTPAKTPQVSGAVPQTPQTGHLKPPVLQPGMTPASHHTMHRQNGQQRFVTPGMTPGPPMPRPLLPRERSTVDKLVEYLVGDGPQNRYALVCSKCLSHNGMALKEEFEYMAFRCCYCYAVNPARKQRPNAPKLDFNTPTPPGERKHLAKNLAKEPSDASNEDSGSDAEEENEVSSVEEGAEESSKS